MRGCLQLDYGLSGPALPEPLMFMWKSPHETIHCIIHVLGLILRWKAWNKWGVTELQLVKHLCQSCCCNSIAGPRFLVFFSKLQQTPSVLDLAVSPYKSEYTSSLDWSCQFWCYSVVLAWRTNFGNHQCLSDSYSSMLEQ